MGLPPQAVERAISQYNGAVNNARQASFNPSSLDGLSTGGLKLPKSNWAQSIDTPPFYGIAMRPGITFTYMGVAINDEARVHRQDGSVFQNVFAAGEIMSGNILSTGYLAGFGLTIGTVWGRIAGSEAARHAVG
jgi:tricarballylate dehydrogenase